MKEQFPWFANVYVNDWPVESVLKQYLKNRQSHQRDKRSGRLAARQGGKRGKRPVEKEAADSSDLGEVGEENFELKDIFSSDEESESNSEEEADGRNEVSILLLSSAIPRTAGN